MILFCYCVILSNARSLFYVTMGIKWLAQGCEITVGVVTEQSNSVVLGVHVALLTSIKLTM